MLNKRLDTFMSGSHQINTSDERKKQPSLKQQISTKMAVADIKGAVRILVSKDSLLSPSEDTINKLKQKHPLRHPDAQNPPPIEEEEAFCFKTNRDELMRALHSFKKGAAGGPDGFLPQHLLDMTGLSLGEPATQLVNALVSLMNSIVFPGKVLKKFVKLFMVQLW